MSSDEETLRSWNFLRDYQSHAKELTDLATSVYMVTCSLFGSRPSQDECYDLYWKVLNKTFLYQNIVDQKSHLPPILHETCAQLLARYVLVQNWTSISQVSCP